MMLQQSHSTVTTINALTSFNRAQCAQTWQVRTTAHRLNQGIVEQFESAFAFAGRFEDSSGELVSDFDYCGAAANSRTPGPQGAREGRQGNGKL